MSDIERLRQEVAETESAIDSAVLLINGMSNRIREALMSESAKTELTQLADELDEMSNRLAVAVAQNTTAEDDSDEVGLSTDTVEGESEEPDTISNFIEPEEGDEGADEGESTAGVDGGSETTESGSSMEGESSLSESTEGLPEEQGFSENFPESPEGAEDASDAETGTTDPTESDSSGNNGQPTAYNDSTLYDLP